MKTTKTIIFSSLALATIFLAGCSHEKDKNLNPVNDTRNDVIQTERSISNLSDSLELISSENKGGVTKIKQEENVTSEINQNEKVDVSPVKNNKSEESSKIKKEGLKNSEFNNIGLEISYPEEWGIPKLDSNILESISFSNLLFTRSDDGYVYNDKIILYEDQVFELSVIDYNNIIKWNDNFTGGGESVQFNLKYFDYMKNKLSSYSENCTESIFGVGNCINLEISTIGGNNYLSYIDFGWHGDWWLRKSWVYFFDDKIVLLQADLNNIADYKSIDRIFYPAVGKGISFEALENIKYNDFGINQDELNNLNETINQFLSSIQFESSITEKEITFNVKEFQDYIDELDLSVNSSDINILFNLSDSNFIKVRRNVASNKNSSIEILKKLSNDSSDIVKVTVKFNSNTPEEIAEKIENPF